MLSIAKIAMLLTLILGCTAPCFSRANSRLQTHFKAYVGLSDDEIVAIHGRSAVAKTLRSLEVDEVSQTLAKRGQEFMSDFAESKIEFFVGSSAGDVNGTFNSWKGELSETAAGVPDSAKLSLEIAASSMTTGSAVKDKIVKGKDFFYTVNYPGIFFTSTKVIPSAEPNKSRFREISLCGVSPNWSPSR